MISEYNTLNQDTKIFLDPVKTLGDIGVELTKADVEKANAQVAAALTGEAEEKAE